MGSCDRKGFCHIVHHLHSTLFCFVSVHLLFIRQLFKLDFFTEFHSIRSPFNICKRCLTDYQVKIKVVCGWLKKCGSWQTADEVVFLNMKKIGKYPCWTFPVQHVMEAGDVTCLLLISYYGNTVHIVFIALVPCINHCKLRTFYDRKNTECLKRADSFL